MDTCENAQISMYINAYTQTYKHSDTKYTETKKERKENGPDRYICISKVMVREIL